MRIQGALETNVQLAEAGKPGMRAFDNPAMLLPSRSFRSMPRPAIRGLMLGLRRCCRQCAKPYPFFA